ncbi:hypothetical protein NPIL_468091 [Nephila pilipes]|uniref:Uncharacterized protein n=1 Tax=Nephila pilipes TaxID=299642 RepID=A0A8X6TS43_NEPPI|nr:hypothetical protein NPIL_468091 [Nephila pilipes]
MSALSNAAMAEESLTYTAYVIRRLPSAPIERLPSPRQRSADHSSPIPITPMPAAMPYGRPLLLPHTHGDGHPPTSRYMPPTVTTRPRRPCRRRYGRRPPRPRRHAVVHATATPTPDALRAARQQRRQCAARHEQRCSSQKSRERSTRCTQRMLICDVYRHGCAQREARYGYT